MSGGYGYTGNYPSSSKYPTQQYPYGNSTYPTSLTTTGYYDTTAMSRSGNYSSGSGSSYGNYSDSTAASSPGSHEDTTPRYSSQQIQVEYAGVAGGTKRQQQSKARQTSSKSQSGSNAPVQYVCLYSGCTYTSARPFDLERHMKKHSPIPAEQKYSCPGKGCGRVGEHGFDRKDHMTEHLRNYHLWDIPKGRNTGTSNGAAGRRG